MNPDEAVREAYLEGSIAFHVECDWYRLDDGSGGIWCTEHKWWVMVPLHRTDEVNELEATLNS